MLQTSDNNNHIHESTDKTNIQCYFLTNCQMEYIIYLMEYILCKESRDDI